MTDQQRVELEDAFQKFLDCLDGEGGQPFHEGPIQERRWRPRGKTVWHRGLFGWKR